VTLDAFPDRTLKAEVESIGAGTGAEFALIPAQNATGNWVKVVQRVPVRIRIDEPLGELPVRAGLSASVSVDTGHQRSLPIIGTALAGN
jgi:membrane fusion protein (multidrug efflux system)